MKCTGAVLAGLVRFAIDVESRPGDFQRYRANVQQACAMRNTTNTSRGTLVA